MRSYGKDPEYYIEYLEVQEKIQASMIRELEEEIERLTSLNSKQKRTIELLEEKLKQISRII